MRVLILTGSVQTGKTSLLEEWLKSHEAGGLLSPVAEGRRYFMSVASGYTWDMEAATDEADTLAVGRYSFSQEAFEQANITLLFDLKARRYPVIIDEIGPLELKGSGLARSLQALTKAEEALVIAVVREGLVEEVKTAFFSTAEEVIVATTDDFNEKARRLTRAFQ